MKPITRKRFIRAFISSILSSELTEKEVMEIMNEFPYDPEMALDIKRALSTVLDLLNTTELHQNESLPMPFGELFDDAYSIIKKRRLSKSSVIGMINAVTGNKGFKSFSENDTMLDILERFYSTSSRREQNVFFEVLNYGHINDDAFLKGIIRK